jgi:hypothetical protein
MERKDGEGNGLYMYTWRLTMRHRPPTTVFVLHCISRNRAAFAAQKQQYAHCPGCHIRCPLSRMSIRQMSGIKMLLSNACTKNTTKTTTLNLHLHLDGKRLEILIVGHIGIDTLAKHLLRLLAILLPPLLVLLLFRWCFLRQPVSNPPISLDRQH